MRITAIRLPLVLAAACAFLLPSRAPAQKPAGPPPLWLGTAWYPEQWPESRWDADLTLMQAAGIRFVRVGEFAWADMEPTEGHYDFTWLDHAIAAAAAHNIVTVLGTPTATPPAWLTQKYPETLRIDETGHRLEHGNRQQFNWDNPKYRELARGIATKMAERYGHNPNVIGWQIDNEYTQVSFDPETHADFQHFLQTRYGTLDNLNSRWTTSYWSQRYTNWNQIPIQTGYGNPGLLLNWKIFVSEVWRSYQLNQLDAIRPLADPKQFYTTNMLGWAQPFDHYTVTQDLTFASFDDYIPQGHLDLAINGSTDDLTRGFKQKNFWIMECQPGAVNWGAINVTLNKGEVRMLAWHNIGHGADAIGYWQWRSALNGQEEYHGTLVGANGEPVPVYDEIAQLGRDFVKAGPALAGTSPHSDVAILHNYESFWAIGWQKHNKNYDPIEALQSYYRPLRELAQSVDIVQPTVPLAGYKLVVAPALNVLSDQAAANLIAYVKGGGHLVLGQRSGMKNSDNGLQPEDQPGPLADLLGGHVEQYYALDDTVPVSGQFGANTSKLWAERLIATSPDTKVIATYGKSNGWLDGRPAILTRNLGKGSITYVGVWMDNEGMKKLAEWMLSTSDVKAAFGPVPEGVEVSPRYGNGHTVYVVVNMADHDRTITLPAAMQDVLNGGTVHSVTLPQYGVSVLEQTKP
jgi:beta-galactosidase